MMEGNKILEQIKRIEIRTGINRTIKSYAIRNNVLDRENEELVLRSYKKYGVFFDENERLGSQYLFGNDKPLVIEIGFGMGTSTYQIAEKNPEYNYLGLEVYLDGVVRLLKSLDEKGLDNLKIMRFNAVDVLKQMVDDSSIDGFHIFFPDPWPKKKHHKRRLIQTPFVTLLASKLKKDGYLYLVTDWCEYSDWMMEVLLKEESLKNKFEAFAPHQIWRPETKFERKGLEKDYEIRELYFLKK